MEVIGRKAGHTGQRLEIQGPVQVPCQVVDDALDALRIALGSFIMRGLTPAAMWTFQLIDSLEPPAGIEPATCRLRISNARGISNLAVGTTVARDSPPVLVSCRR